MPFWRSQRELKEFGTAVDGDRESLDANRVATSFGVDDLAAVSAGNATRETGAASLVVLARKFVAEEAIWKSYDAFTASASPEDWG
jgi:hypothetical protein